MNRYLYYSKVTRIIALLIFAVHVLISLLFYKEVMFRTKLSLTLISAFVLFFSLSFLFRERAEHNSFGAVIRKWNNAEGILNALAFLLFAGQACAFIFYDKTYFLNSKYRFILAHFSLAALSLGLILKHTKDRSVFSRIKIGLYAVILLVVLYSIGKIFS